MSTERDTEDISAHLPLLHTLWQQGVLNAFDYRELNKIALNHALHHLISGPLLRFVASLKQIESHHNNNEEKKQHNDDGDAPIEEKMNIVQEIKTFQACVRPLITRAIHLSFSSHNGSCSRESERKYHHVLNALAENTILPKNILFLIEKSILSTTSTADNIENMIQLNENHCLSTDDCYDFVHCSDEKKLNQKTLCMLQSVLTEEISVFNECQESLADEINIIKSIFSETEQEHIVVHKETFPIIIELCLSSKNNVAKLYMTFLCAIDYPIRSAIKSSIYFCGPCSFATDNEIWNELKVPLQQMTRDSMGDAHLFDVIQFAKEWMERFEARYDKLQKQSFYGHDCCKYIELRTALGLNVDKAAINGVDQTAIEIKNEKKKSSTNQSDKEYIWYIKDVNNNWCEFPQNMQTKINNLSINGGVLFYSSNNYEYIITKHSPAKAIQTNRATHTQREIKRRIRNKKKQETKKEAQNTQIATQCHSRWEIDEIIRKLIAIMSIKWQCSKAIAVQKLSQSLWNYDNDAMHMMKDKMHNDDDGDTDDITLTLPSIEEFKCAVCLEIHSMFAGIAIECEHIICVECLSNYIVNQVNNGILCIKCPEFECKSLLNEYIVHILSDDISYKRYRQFLQNSFLETAKDFNFCPNPACDSAIHYHANSKRVPLLVCNCNIPLCTACIAKFHWPLTCRENKQWSNKCNAKIKLSDPNLPDLPKFEGQKYEMIVKTKACPRCKTQWEKNGGCNHILCRKCQYHFCWVCLKEFNHFTHDDFYECKTGIVESSQSNKITMDQPTERYLSAYKEALEKRKQIREEHQAKIAGDITKKLNTKRAIQHERASIFLEQKYFKKTKRLKILLRNIICSTQQNGDKLPKQLNMLFMYELISRMIQTHLLLSRGYKFMAYHDIADSDTICCILKSLEHVAFKLDAMFQQPKVYLPYEQCRWKWHDCGFYIEFFITEMMKICSIQKKEKKKKTPKQKKTNPFMRVSNHKY